MAVDATRYLERFAERRPGAAEIVVGSLVLAGAPTAIGACLGLAFGEWPCFAIYFPAILLAAVLLGWRAGLLVTLLSAISSTYFLSRSPMAMGLTSRESVVAAVEYWVSAVLIVLVAALLRSAFARLSVAAEREHELNLELRHRVNNSLALALAFASQTKRSASEPEVFYASFRKRLVALARAQDILSSESILDRHLPNLAETALEAFTERALISLSGSPCLVSSASCVPLVLALHELATNAVKHGALSVPGGRVSLSWTINEPAGADPEIVLIWSERGGPPVRSPTRLGLGSRLLIRQPGLDDVDLQYDPAGLRCAIRARGTMEGGAMARSVAGQVGATTERPRARPAHAAYPERQDV